MLRSFQWILVLLMIGCQIGETDSRYSHQNIPIPAERGVDEGFLGEDAATFLPVTYLDQLFELQEILPLEMGEESTVGMVTDLIHHDKHWYVLDQMTYRVYKFTEEGAFVSKFGGRGSGPGEFEYPKRMRLCFGNRLGIADPVQGKIHLFTPAGTYLKTTRPASQGMMIMPRHSFIWAEEEALVISAFGTLNPKAPVHVVLDAREEPHHLRFGFGTRIPDIEKAVRKGAPRRAYTAMELIDGRYWAGSPYGSHVEIFNKKGELLGRVGDQGFRDEASVVSPADFDGVHLKKNPAGFMKGEINQKRGVELICQIGEWVLVRMGRIYDVYTIHGQRVAANLVAKDMALNYAYDDRLVMVIPAGIDPQTMPDSPLKKKLLASGYGPQDNPYLAIFKWVLHPDLG